MFVNYIQQSATNIPRSFLIHKSELADWFVWQTRPSTCPKTFKAWLLDYLVLKWNRDLKRYIFATRLKLRCYILHQRKWRRGVWLSRTHHLEVKKSRRRAVITGKNFDESCRLRALCWVISTTLMVSRHSMSCGCVAPLAELQRWISLHGRNTGPSHHAIRCVHAPSLPIMAKRAPSSSTRMCQPSHASKWSQSGSKVSQQVKHLQ